MLLYPVEAQKNLLSMAQLTLNDSFVVTGIKVCSGKNGVFVDMPSKKDGNGEYRHSAYPVTKEFRKKLSDAVLENYQKTLEGTQKKIARNNLSAADVPETEIVISVKPVQSQKSVVGLAEVTLNQCFVVKDIKVCTGKNGLFVAMPSEKNRNGEYRDTAFPITKEFRKQLFERVLVGYEKKKAKDPAEKKPSVIDDIKKSRKKPLHMSLLKLD